MNHLIIRGSQLNISLRSIISLYKVGWFRKCIYFQHLLDAICNFPNFYRQGSDSAHKSSFVCRSSACVS